MAVAGGSGGTLRHGAQRVEGLCPPSRHPHQTGVRTHLLLERTPRQPAQDGPDRQRGLLHGRGSAAHIRIEQREHLPHREGEEHRESESRGEEPAAQGRRGARDGGADGAGAAIIL